MTELEHWVRPDGIDVEGITALARTADPEYVANSRDNLVGMAALMRALRDPLRLRESLRAARLVEWEMTRRWPPKPRGAHRDDDRPPLSPAGDGADAESWQKVYAVGRANRDAILTATEIEDLSQRAFRTAHVGQNTGVPEWYTPPELIAAARRVLGGIDLDPASSAIANETVQADRYFTADDDGLAHDWHGRVWMNPPYNVGVIDRFVAKLLEEYEHGNVADALVLTNNSTDTRWWQSMGAKSAAVCLVSGRVRFLDPDGNTGTPLQGQTICYLGQRAARFVEEFDCFGVVR